MSEVPEPKQRQNWTFRFVTVFSVLSALFFIVNVSGILEYSGIYLDALTKRAAYLLVLLILVFLQHKKSYRLTWDGALFIAAALVSMGYIALFPQRIYLLAGSRLPLGNFEIAMGFLAVIAMLEAVRRKLGLVVALVMLFFFLYPTISNFLPGILNSKSVGLKLLTHQIYISDQGIFGSITEIAVTLVFIFIMFGSFLEITGAGDWYMKVAISLVGHMSGGAAKASVISSALFGTISGSPSAIAASIGMLTIPLIKREGFSASFAGGLTAAAAVGGVYSPPIMGTVAFIMSEWLGISYWQVCVAAFLPSALYYVAVFIMLHEESKRLKLRTTPRAELPKLIPTLKEGWYWTLPIVVLVVLLGVLDLPTEKAGFWSLVMVVLLSLFKKQTRLTPGKTVQCLRGGMQSNLTAGIAIGMAGLIVGAINLTGIGLRLSGSIVDISGGNLPLLLLLSALTCLVLGLGLPSIPAYIMTVAFVAPALTKLGIAPLAAHMFVFYVATLSFITPPECTAAFVAAGIANANPMLVAFQACRLAVVAFIVPFVFVYEPAILMMDSPGDIVMYFTVACVGIVAIGIGFVGYLFDKVNWFSRLLLIGAGIEVLFTHGVYLWIGLLILAIAVAPQIYSLLTHSKNKVQLS